MIAQVVRCVIIGLAIVSQSAAEVSPPRGYPFNDVSLSWTERVDDLVSRLTLDEMTDQMAYGGRETHAPGIERLGIAPYPWGSECLRGDVSAGPATSFAQALGLAATFR
jgi:beta-glucosidase